MKNNFVYRLYDTVNKKFIKSPSGTRFYQYRTWADQVCDQANSIANTNRYVVKTFMLQEVDDTVPELLTSMNKG